MNRLFNRYSQKFHGERGFALIIVTCWLVYFGFVQLNLTEAFDLFLSKGVLFCPFHKITGVECPGCGMTRAFLALAKFNILSAFKFNPFSIPLFIYLFFLLLPLKTKKRERDYKFVKISILVLILSWWLLTRVIVLSS